LSPLTPAPPFPEQQIKKENTSELRTSKHRERDRKNKRSNQSKEKQIQRRSARRIKTEKESM
jgi:hypothetical protein